MGSRPRNKSCTANMGRMSAAALSALHLLTKKQAANIGKVYDNLINDIDDMTFEIKNFDVKVLHPREDTIFWRSYETLQELKMEHNLGSIPQVVNLLLLNQFCRILKYGISPNWKENPGTKNEGKTEIRDEPEIKVESMDDATGPGTLQEESENVRDLPMNDDAIRDIINQCDVMGQNDATNNCDVKCHDDVMDHSDVKDHDDVMDHHDVTDHGDVKDDNDFIDHRDVTAHDDVKDHDDVVDCSDVEYHDGDIDDDKLTSVDGRADNGICDLKDFIMPTQPQAQLIQQPMAQQTSSIPAIAPAPQTLSMAAIAPTQQTLSLQVIAPAQQMLSIPTISPGQQTLSIPAISPAQQTSMPAIAPAQQTSMPAIAPAHYTMSIPAISPAQQTLSISAISSTQQSLSFPTIAPAQQTLSFRTIAPAPEKFSLPANPPPPKAVPPNPAKTPLVYRLVAVPGNKSQPQGKFALVPTGRSRRQSRLLAKALAAARKKKANAASAAKKVVVPVVKNEDDEHGYCNPYTAPRGMKGVFQSLGEAREMLAGVLVPGFHADITEERAVFTRYYSGHREKLSVTVQPDLSYTLQVHGVPLPPEHPFLTARPPRLISHPLVTALLTDLNRTGVCVGNPDADLQIALPGPGAPVPERWGRSSRAQGYRHNWPGIRLIHNYTSTIRTHECLYLSDTLRCQPCKIYRARLKYLCTILNRQAAYEKDGEASTAKFYPCTHCDKVLFTIRCLKEHEEIHAVDRPHKCDQCSKSFKRARDVKDHKKACHNPADDKEGMCPTCGRMFPDLRALRRHEAQHKARQEVDRPAGVCSFCGKLFSQESSLRQHEARHRNPPRKYPRKRPSRAKLRDAAPGNAGPVSAVPGNAVPGDVAPGNAVPGNAVPGNAVPGDVAPRNDVPGNAVSVAVPGNTGPGNDVPGNDVPVAVPVPDKPATSTLRRVSVRVLHKCNTCNKLFHTQDALREHTEQFPADQPCTPDTEISVTGQASPGAKLEQTEVFYACAKCNRIFQNEAAISLHACAEGDIRFRCDVCKEGFRSYSSLQGHKSTH